MLRVPAKIPVFSYICDSNHTKTPTHENPFTEILGKSPYNFYQLESKARLPILHQDEEVLCKGSAQTGK
jgi:hypothetical protein